MENYNLYKTDYWWINTYTIHNQYPLPLFSELIANLSGAHIFPSLTSAGVISTCILRKEMSMKQCSRWSMGYGNQQWCFFLALPTLLQCSRQWWMKFIDQLLKNGLNVEHALKSTWMTLSLPPAQMMQITEAVKDILQVAENHELYFKPEKCIFHTPCIDYLGVILEKGMICMDPVKIEGIKFGLHQPKLRTFVHFWAFAIFMVHSYS